jgi:uncharacterized protein (DUF58 family)
MSLPRPRHVAGPLFGSIVTLGAWGLVAHNSGSGWVQAVGTLLAGVLVTGLLAPAVVVSRVRLRCEASPPDATVGVPAELTLRASHRVRVRPLAPPGPEVAIGPRSAHGGAADPGDPVNLIPARRGVTDRMVVEVATAAPFALVWWTRRVVVRLPTELHVGPRLGAPLPLPRRPDDRLGEESRPAPDLTGEPRGVRAYRPGDSRRRVHWPATAHHATLMVRETERPATAGVVIRVSLPADPEAADRTAERAYGTVTAALDRSVPVILTTLEVDGPRTKAVGDRRSAARRLARAVSTGGDHGPDLVEGVDVTISDPSAPGRRR